MLYEVITDKKILLVDDEEDIRDFLKRNRFLAALLGWLFASLSFWFWIFNFGHYAYLSAPLNSGILEFGANADTSFLMIWQSYLVQLRIMYAIRSYYDLSAKAPTSWAHTGL